MTCSGILSPTLTELNSRSVIAEATLSIFRTPPGQRRVVLLDDVAVFVSDHNLIDHDVGAVGLADLVHVHIAEKLVTGHDRVQEFQDLVDVDDLVVGQFDAVVGEGRHLCDIAEHRDERQWRRQAAIAEFGGGLVAEELRAGVLHRIGVLARLLPLDHVVVGVTVVRAENSVG